MNIVNTKINKWYVLEKSNKNKWGSQYYLCKCECGTIKSVAKADLLSNKSSQCAKCGYKFGRDISVLKSPLIGKGNNFRHGMNKTPTHRVWLQMRVRCNAIEGKNYKWYKSRGIKVCDRWNKFVNFLEDMGEKPPKMYLDRINNDLGYFKENCRWVNAKINSQNRRNVKNKPDLINLNKQKINYPE